MYVCPSTKSFSDLNEIWFMGRGRWVVHDGVPYGPIQGQGHMALKVRNSHQRLGIEVSSSLKDM